MFLREISVLCFFLPLVLGVPVDIQVTQVKKVGKKGDTFRLTGKCLFKDAVPGDAGDYTFSIQLDRPSDNFKSKHATLLETRGNAYTVTNAVEITGKRFNVIFYVQFNGSDSCWPTGSCTSLEPVPTTTSSTTSTTQAPAESMELLENTGMESNFTDNWSCHTDCTLEASNDSYRGAMSAKVTNRNAKWKGLSQWVNITAGLRYSLSGFIKLLNVEAGSLYHNVETVMYCGNDQGGTKYLKFGSNILTQPDIWIEIGGIVEVPSGYDTFRVYISVSGATVDYLADDISLQELVDDPDWKMKAEARIESIRKADFSIRVTSSNPLPSNLTVEIKQDKHEFAFGSVVGAEEIVSTDPMYQKYQEWFYEHFEWGLTGNALKWKSMERVQGDINYDRPTQAINAMRSRGIKVRGHNVFWGVDRWVPDWVKSSNQSELLEEMTTRINGVIGNTTGLLEHWDVNNENQHGDFYERQSWDVNITMQMFRDVHAIDPDVKLFLNDYGILESSRNQKATAIKAQAQMFREAGVPIYGVGIQSHISVADVQVFKARLDKVAEAGLPLWITELSMIEPDENIKAQALEDVMTLYFSHPAVEGIILWGFWDGRIWKANATLVEGPDLTPNAAGLTYQRLFKETWRTSMTRDVPDSNPIELRGFKGEYSVKVKQDDVMLNSETFVLDNSGAMVDIVLP